mgnify:CR=1 FL=1
MALGVRIAAYQLKNYAMIWNANIVLKGVLCAMKNHNTGAIKTNKPQDKFANHLIINFGSSVNHVIILLK